MIDFEDREDGNYLAADHEGVTVLLLFHLLECGFNDFILADESIALSFSSRKDEFEKLNDLQKVGEILSQNKLNITLLPGGYVVELYRSTKRKARKKNKKAE